MPTHRRATTGAETDLLTRARNTLVHTAQTGVHLDEGSIRARLQEAMARPAAAGGTGPAAPTAHDDAHTQALATVSTTSGVNR
ncbi:hypothetical protein O1L68_40350 [Streptomyces lydicus]|nr:hypothetical protein [Streptomyces lydicus]